MNVILSCCLACAFALLAVLPASGAAAMAGTSEQESWLCSARTENVVISSAAEFRQALDAVREGGSISLRPGRYDRLMVRKFRPDGLVIIGSADPERPAEIGALIVDQSSRLWFQQLHFALTDRPRGDGVYLVRVRRASDVAIVASEFHGSVDGDYANDPLGARMDRSERVIFAGNRLHDLTRGVVLNGVRRARVTDNHFADLRTDGANFAGVQHVVVDRNFFTKFHPIPKDHPDFIQFWQRNAAIEDTRGVVIRENTMLQGTGSPTQSIFIGNRVEGRVYRDFVIEENVIYNSHPHGISIADLRGGRVAHNTLVAFPGGNPTFRGGKYAPRINLFRSQGVTVMANVAGGYRGRDSRDIVLGENVFTGVSPPSVRRMEALFIDPGARAGATRSSLAPRPGGPLDRPQGRRIGALATAAGAARPAARRVRAEAFGDQGCAAFGRAAAPLQ